MAPETPGFQIAGRFYPMPGGFKLGDPVLIEEVTGLEWDRFLDRLPDETDDEGTEDPVVMLGLVAVAVWHANPGWRRDKVVRFVQSVDREAVEVFGGDDDDGGDAGPPAPTEAGQDSSETSASSSESDSDTVSPPSPPTPSGTAPSATTPAPSDPAT